MQIRERKLWNSTNFLVAYSELTPCSVVWLVSKRLKASVAWTYYFLEKRDFGEQTVLYRYSSALFSVQEAANLANPVKCELFDNDGHK